MKGFYLSVENTGIELVTFPKAFGTLYQMSWVSFVLLISHSMYFLLFSRCRASRSERKDSVCTISQGMPAFVERLRPLLC